MRQFIAPSEPDAHGRLTVSGKNFRYLRNVLRLQPDDLVDVRLNDGQLCKMRVAEIKTSGSMLILERCGSAAETMRSAAETGVQAQAVNISAAGLNEPLWLFQFMPKPQKMDLIVRQAAETGVSVIVPVTGSRSQKSDCTERLDRWQRIIREARQQSGSPIETAIFEPLPVEAALHLWSERCGLRPCAVILHEDPHGCLPLHGCVAQVRSGSELCTAAAAAVGCEGGIAPEELAAFRSAGFVPVHFNTNILRTETAALYGIAALQIILTEYTSWQ